MKKIVMLLVLAFSISTVMVSCKEHKEETENNESRGAEKADLALNDAYQCPMDCENGKTYEEEGKCPVCKMDLKKVEKEHEETHEGESESEDAETQEGDDDSEHS